MDDDEICIMCGRLEDYCICYDECCPEPEKISTKEEP